VKLSEYVEETLSGSRVPGVFVRFIFGFEVVLQFVEFFIGDIAVIAAVPEDFEQVLFLSGLAAAVDVVGYNQDYDHSQGREKDYPEPTNFAIHNLPPGIGAMIRLRPELGRPQADLRGSAAV